MIDLYFSQLKPSEIFTQEILRRFYGISDPILCKNEHGKPFLQNHELHFSLSHSRDKIALAVGDFPIGLDIEAVRPIKKYDAILRRLSPDERAEIHNEQDFFRNWTAKESYVKLRGISLLPTLSELEFYNSTLFFKGKKLDVSLQCGLSEGCAFAVCTQQADELTLHIL